MPPAISRADSPRGRESSHPTGDGSRAAQFPPMASKRTVFPASPDEVRSTRVPGQPGPHTKANRDQWFAVHVVLGGHGPNYAPLSLAYPDVPAATGPSSALRQH